jgi:hypothetical protein
MGVLFFGKKTQEKTAQSSGQLLEISENICIFAIGFLFRKRPDKSNIFQTKDL